MGLPELFIILFFVGLPIFVVYAIIRAAVRGGVSDAQRSAASSSARSRDGTPRAAIFCIECGAGNSRDARFCMQCGHAIDGVT